MICSNCGCNSCQLINEYNTTGKDFSAGKGCCGYFLLGPIGILCGLCGSNKQVNNQAFWVCNNCGYKFKA